MSNLILFAGSIADWFKEIWVNLWLSLDYVIYTFIDWVYRVFILVAKVDIFGDGKELTKIADRLYVIIGVAMLFILAYNIILLIVNPDGKQIGDMGKVVKNAIVSVVLITLLPVIFSFLTTVQIHVLDENVIGHIIFGTANVKDTEKEVNTQGLDVSRTIFSAFYHPNDDSYLSCKIPCGEDGNRCPGNPCAPYIQAYNNASSNSKLSDFILSPELKSLYLGGQIEYTYFLSTVAGIFALWMFVSFALDIGIRVGKLAFYQLISPIPIMMRILPGDKMYDKWFKGITSTYLSLFIRLIIIFFCVYAVGLVPNIIDGLKISSNEEPILRMIASVVLMLGLLQFAKDAPKLVSDLFGGGEGIKFGIKDKYKTAAAPITGAVRGGVYGATTGDGWNRVSGFFRGAGKGALKGYDAAVSSVDGIRDAKRDGSTAYGRTLDRLRVAAGMKTRYDSLGTDEEKKLKKARIEDREKNNQAFLDATDNFKKISENVVTSRDSLYHSVDGYGEVYDEASKITYSLANKNHYEMQEVVEEARRNNASADTIISLTQAMEKHKDSRTKLVQQTALHDGKLLLSDNDKKYENQMSRAKQQINNALEDGAAQYVDKSNGKLVSGVTAKDASGEVIRDEKGNAKIVTKVDDIEVLKAAIKDVNNSKLAIEDEKRTIHKEHSKHKAERADSNYVKNSIKDKK